jgi:glycosyltransferase involved in cell wall biosynthesis
MSAFACEPGKGSEPEVGLRALLAAAERHTVWVLTDSAGAASLQGFLDGHPLGTRVHIEPIPLGVDAKRLSLINFHRHYDRWQRQAMRRALELDRAIGFDVVHHVTMSTVWTRVGVAAVPKPLVWGPVGGGVEPPLPLLSELGLGGLLSDAVRVASRRLLAKLPPMRTAPRTAAVVLAQNRQIVPRLGTGPSVVVLPNATAVDVSGVQPDGDRTHDVVLVGRIIAWKGGRIAVRAMQHVTDPQAVLRVFGEGPDQARLERATRRLGIRDRVRFEGWIPRDALLPQVARAGVLVHPSLHDDASLCVAEALSLGTPVVCLDHGGPAEVVRRWSASPAHLVAPTGVDSTARQMAKAIDGFLAHPPPVRRATIPPDTPFADALLAAYERAACSAERIRQS